MKPQYSHRLKWNVGWRWKLDSDCIAGTYKAFGLNNAHDPGLSDEIAIRVATQGGSHQPILNAV